MEQKLEQDGVLICELKNDKDRNSRPYLVVIDGFGVRWNLFGELANYKLTLGKGYVFKYERNGEFKNVKEIEPLANIFKREALKELSSKSDIIRNVSISVGQAIQCFAIENKIPNHEDLFTLSDKIYNYVTQKTNEEYDKINQLPKPKDVK